jgi:protein TonB
VARQKGYQGKVKIRVHYNHEGSMTKIDIIESSGIKMLDEAIKNAALDWKISPSSINGPGSFEKVFEFKLKN